MSTLPTLREVARAAGVSTASVSRALSGGAKVSEKLDSRIRAAATRLGYVPNLFARSLASRRSALIGFMIGRSLEPVTNQILRTCEAKLAASGFGAMVAFPGEMSALSAAEAFLGRGAQAFVAVGISAEPGLRQMVAKRGIPWLDLDPATAVSGRQSIGIGRREGAVLAARYLESMGHKRFAAIASSDVGVIDAVRGALTEESLLLDFSSGDSAPAAIRVCVGREDRATAIICQDDAVALATLRECACRGIPVPRAVSVIGFGDSEFARCAYPSLSTVRVATEEVGRCLAETILASLEGRDFPQPPVPVKLIARETTAVAPARAGQVLR